MLSDERLVIVREDVTLERIPDGYDVRTRLTKEGEPEPVTHLATLAEVILYEHIDALTAELTKLRAERDRLRAACELVVNFWNPNHPAYEEQDWNGLVDEFVDKCRAALADAPAFDPLTLCPMCHERNVESVVQKGASMQTLIGSVRPGPDPNYHYTECVCSYGHRWKVTRKEGVPDVVTRHADAPAGE